MAIIFKERYYETGLPKTWLFTSVDHVAIVQGRVHLCRRDYGLVCDLPCQDVAQVYPSDGDMAGHYVQDTRQAMHDTKSGQASAA